MKALYYILLSFVAYQTVHAHPHQNGDRRSKVDLTITSHKRFVKSLEKLRGKVVALYFWANYSAPDILTLQKLADLPVEKNKNWALVTVAIDGSQASGKSCKRNLANAKVNYLNYMLNDLDDAPALEYWGIVVTPALIILDAKGKVVRRFEVSPLKDVQKAIKRIVERDSK